jgi:hypothetical protein
MTSLYLSFCFGGSIFTNHIILARAAAVPLDILDEFVNTWGFLDPKATVCKLNKTTLSAVIHFRKMKKKHFEISNLFYQNRMCPRYEKRSIMSEC